MDAGYGLGLRLGHFRDDGLGIVDIYHTYNLRLFYRFALPPFERLHPHQTISKNRADPHRIYRFLTAGNYHEFHCAVDCQGS
jgi:hypothetical protein